MAKWGEKKADNLHIQVQERLDACGSDLEISGDLSPEEAQRLVHELQVHQIELEMQNEELRLAQEEVEAGRASYLELYDFAPVGYATVNTKGIILCANLTLVSMLGIDRQALQGKPLSHFVTGEGADRLYLHYRQVPETQQRRFCELRMIQADGGHFHARLETVPVTDECGKHAGYRIVISDITTLWQAEQELRLAKEQAEHANNAKSEFMCRMSHELRTPMNAILGFAQLLNSEKQQLNGDHSAAVEHILGAGKHLLDVIDDVLDINRVDIGELELSLEDISLEMVISSALLWVKSEAFKKGVTLPVPPTDELWVRADSARLKQVLVNLLTNAVKYNRKEGEIGITVAAVPEVMVRFSVSDAGIGIKTEDQARIFDPFHRALIDGECIEGTGIGLTITKKLVEAMGGRIGVESEQGRGSTFWFELPQAEPVVEKPVEKNIQVPAYPTPAPGMDAWKVLYVEDDPINMLLVKSMFKRLPGFVLLTALDAEQGITVARDQRPGLILMDIQLPGMDGYAALKILRDDARTAHIPVIAVSANAMPKELAKGRKAGFQFYMTKPIMLDEFMTMMGTVFKGAEYRYQ